MESAGASQMIGEGLAGEDSDILRAVHGRYRVAGHYWDHGGWGMHCMRPMAAWAMIAAVEGLLYDS